MKEDYKHSGISRRGFLKIFAGFSFFGVVGAARVFASEEESIEEPEFLDAPTPFQEGDPEPFAAEVPEVEPEQSSTEAPPCQPIEDEQPEQPSKGHQWVSGYWWWNNQSYVWVPGYWAIPPLKNYVYIPGYWNHRGGQWVYVRGGWGTPQSTKVIVYASPRPRRTAFVLTAPLRILRRRSHWRYYPARRVRRRVVRRKNRRIRRRERRR